VRSSERLLVAIALALSISSAYAAVAADKPLTPQQQRMADCNKQASGKTGDERKTFMSSCLKSGTPTASAPTTPQERMKACNADATKQSLKGDARKAYLSTCLKSTSSP
jgi:hypothetical protein